MTSVVWAHQQVHLHQYAAITKTKVFLNKFTSFLISTSLFLAITGSFKVLFSCLLFNIFASRLILATFFVIFSVYGLNKLTDLKEDTINRPERAELIKKMESVFKFSLIPSFVLALLLGFSVDVSTLPILLFPLFSGVLYSVKFSKNLPRLKDILGVKNLSIATTWAVGSAILPVVCLLEKDMPQILLIFYFFFAKSFINAVLFDVKDIKGDRRSGIRTIPVVFGRKRTKNLLLILNSIFIPWIIYSYLSGYFHIYFIVLVLSIGYGYWYILYFCREENTRKSLDLLVDGEWIPVVMLAAILTQFA